MSPPSWTRIASWLLVLAVVCSPWLPSAQSEEEGAPAAEPPLPASWQKALTWRSIGPGNMGGRITAIAVNESNPKEFWLATASGGLLYTNNNGVTFEHQFDRERTVSIGDVAVAPSDPKIVWVGTGESNPRNSVSWGNGVYKSEDGGKTWTHMGLEDTFQIGAVRIHPTNPNIVYVGAAGRLWGPNEQRGLFKTTDGGKTWEKILYVDEKTGVIDVQMHPMDSETLLVAMWERRRDGFDTNDPWKRWGPGSGLYKTTDGGKSFEKITEGLPTCDLGRMGIDFCRSNPSVVYMVLDSERIGKAPPNTPYLGINGADAEVGARLTRIVEDGPAAQAGLKADDIVIAMDGETIHGYTEFVRMARRHVAGDTVKLEVIRERESVFLDLTFGIRPENRERPEGEEEEEPTPEDRIRQRGPPSERESGLFTGSLGGQVADVQDQQGNEGHEYGGIYKSTDGGDTWTRVNSINPRPMYFSEIRVDPSDEQKIHVLGIRLWRSDDGGEHFEVAPARGVHVDHHALWIDPEDGDHMILGNDGGTYVTYDRGEHWDHWNHVAIGQFYHVGIGPRRNYRVYGGLQDNGSWGGPTRVRNGRGPTNHDWIRIGGGDGFRCLVDEEDPDQIYFESQNGGVARRHLGTGEQGFMRPGREQRGRGGARQPGGENRERPEYRFNWYTPFMLSHHNSRIYYVAGNYVFRSLNRGRSLRSISPEITATNRGSATAFAESPRDAGLLYVGTDDGALWTSRDGGHTWVDLFAQEEAAPPEEPRRPTEPQEIAERGGPRAEEEPAEEPSPAEEETAGEAPAGGESPPAEAEAPEPVEEPQLSERAARLKARLMRMDANRDGILDSEEIPERMRDFVGRGDQNGDGALDPKELNEMLAGMGGGAGGPARGGRAPVATPGGRPIAELVPERRYVSWVEPSRFETNRVYLVLDGHRSDDDRAHVFVSEDSGATWRSLTEHLPARAGTTRVLREDLENPDLLYLGTEFGAWCSIDRGAHWLPLGSNLPTVAVHAFALHPTADEIVAATHGRSLWVMNVKTLRQMDAKTLAAPAHLFAPSEAIMWRPQPSQGSVRTFVGENPPDGIQIHYALKEKTDGVKLEVLEEDGNLIRALEAPTEAGLHEVRWDLRRPRPPNRRRGPGPRVPPGNYRIVLTVGETTYTQDVAVNIDPEHPDPTWVEFENEAEEFEIERLEAKARRRAPASDTMDD
ncbi:MAG: VPS10 domain-containing protein [Planctomycetota bacterium]|jgi:photosystem II stability/assembly factor-like uncharacterized protein